MHYLHNNLGIVFRETGLFEEAKREFRIAIKLKPNYMEAIQNLEQLTK